MVARGRRIAAPTYPFERSSSNSSFSDCIIQVNYKENKATRWRLSFFESPSATDARWRLSFFESPSTDPLETRLHFCRWQKLWCRSRPAGFEQVSTGHLHSFFESPSAKKKTTPWWAWFFFYLVTRWRLELQTHCLKGNCSTD